MTGEIDLNEEYQTKHDTYFIRPCQVDLAKQYARSWGNDDRRHELPKIEGSRKHGHFQTVVQGFILHITHMSCCQINWNLLAFILPF